MNGYNEEDRPVALVVLAHHRSDSLTASMAERAANRLEGDGYRVDLLNLHAEGFDPRNSVADEPDYGDRDKTYSAEVHRHIRRVHAAEVIVVVFPVWWFGLPALLKGWFDRVWNYGLAYGRSRSPMAGKRMLWLALAGLTARDPNADLVASVLEGPLRRGVSEYCGISETHAAVLYDSEGQDLSGEARAEHFRGLVTRADEAVDKLLAG